jgi:uncharacterized protein
MKYLLLILVSILQITNFTFGADDNQDVNQLVIDKANVFSENEIAELTNKLNNLSKETSTQILVYTTKDLEGYDIADFAQRLGESIGVGQKESDNGIVIVFKPKTKDSNGKVTIQVGYGIEPLIPDVTANRIINNEMIPSFKQGKVFEGINKAVDVCISLTKGEFVAKQYNEKTNNSNSGGIFSFIIFIIIFIIVFRKSNNSYNTGSRSNLPLWAALFFMSGNSSSSGSGWNDFSSGSGGFGGFGGGGFGGGGASGSW